jgi:regulator of nucleoside diphosphate kinase
MYDVFNAAARPPVHLIDFESDLVANLALRSEHQQPRIAAMLLHEIDRAEIHSPDTLPQHVVRLGSKVDFVDESSNRSHHVELVLPGEANIAEGRISIMTPVGAALYGLAAGETIEWRDADDRSRRIRVTAVEQPAEGGRRLS